MAFEFRDGFCEPCESVAFTSVKAEFFCADCRERYCRQCSLDHSKFRVLRNHRISSLSLQSSCEESDYLTPVNTRNTNECCHDDGNKLDENAQGISDRCEQSGIQTEQETYDNLVFDTSNLHGSTGKYRDAGVGNNNTFPKEDCMVIRGSEKSAELDLVSGEFVSVLSLGTHDSKSESDKIDYENTLLKTNPNGHSVERTEMIGKNVNVGLNSNSKSELGNKTDSTTKASNESTNETTNETSVSFNVKVGDTDLIKRIKGIKTKTTVYKFTINDAGIHLSLHGTSLFHCGVNTIRRYWIKSDHLGLELGRRCDVGEGNMILIGDQPKEMRAALQTITQSNTSKEARHRKL